MYLDIYEKYFGVGPTETVRLSLFLSRTEVHVWLRFSFFYYCFIMSQIFLPVVVRCSRFACEFRGSFLP